MEFKPLISLSPMEFAFQIMNTLLMFLLLKKFLFQPVLNIIAEREKDIQNEISIAEEAKTQGMELKGQYEEKIKTADQKSQEIIQEARVRAEEKSTQIITTAENEVRALKEKASKDIEQERQKAINEIKEEISDIAILAASKVIEEDLDKSKHERLISDFIKEVGESK